MFEKEELILLPVSIMSEISDQGTYFSRKITETFSQKYSGNQYVPKTVIMELATIFKMMDGEFAFTRIEDANHGFCAFCDFLIANDGGLESIYHLTTHDVRRFLVFCQTYFPTGWRNRFSAFMARLRNVVDVVWPKLSLDKIQTEGFSVSTSAIIRDALKKEIDRIKKKIGRLENDLRKGKVLEIDLSLKKVRAKDIPGFQSIRKEDIIKTIKHYLPQFPLDRLKNTGSNHTNPGHWLLSNIKNTRSDAVTRILHKHFSSLENMYDYYFPTAYDATCILIHFGMVTGWNRQVVESVGCDELNLRFHRNHMMGAWSKDHEIIRGKKIRGQSKVKPKYFSHISDKNDEYGLYNVLINYYELTKTIRFYSDPLESRCIFIALQERDPFIGYFGPGAKISTFGKLGAVKKKSTHIEKFLEKHNICYDADSAKPRIRIMSLTWRQLRTSYETVLEDMELPLYARKMLLGHNSIDTSMFPYGSDKHSSETQMEKLGKTLAEIHEDYRCAKFFQGAFLTPENDPRRHKKNNQKVVSIARTNWKDNCIMLCSNSFKPSWPGHERYVQDGDECTHLGKCLFCAQCLIGKETLPYLAQWDMDILEYFEEEGDWDSDLKLLELRQAIREALDIWSQENNPEEVRLAKATAMRSDFQRIPLDIWHIGYSANG